MSDYSLVYFFGGQNAKKTDLGPATIKAGLMPDNNIIVPRKYKFVSRYHAEFLLIKGMPHIKDISKNGTWVNDKKLDFNHEIKLKHQDEIRLLPTHEPNHEELILTFIDLTEIMGTAPTPPITNNDGKPEEVKGSHYISHHGGEFYYDDNQMIPFKYTAKSVFKHVYENNGKLVAKNSIAGLLKSDSHASAHTYISQIKGELKKFTTYEYFETRSKEGYIFRNHFE